ALTNGTQFMAAFGALALADARAVLDGAVLATAMALEAKASVLDAFDPRLHAARAQRFQEETAADVRRLCAGSEILRSPVNSARLRAAALRLAEARDRLLGNGDET